MRARSNPRITKDRPGFGPTTKSIVTPLLLVAFLFCHGFLGAVHQIPDPPDRSHLAGGHSSHAPAGGLCGHPGMCLGHPEYAAVLVSVLFGAVIGLLLNSARWSGLAASGLPERSFPPLILHPPRGPTVSLMQVFRL